MQPATAGTDVVPDDSVADTLANRAIAALAPDGPLSAVVEGFVARDGQLALAEAIADAIEASDCLIAEAGTGIGKTFAYLVPVLLSGRRTIVSTGTRALQDQLFHRDLPRVRAALGISVKAALLKGRSNYLCLYRAERARGDFRFGDARVTANLHDILDWSRSTASGDLGEIGSLADDSPLWPAITSTVENCLNSECPFWDDCFVVRARARAQAADLVVVNHHLLLADLALKHEGHGELLPGAATFVLDEAHQLPDLASQFFGDGVSARQISELCRDALAACAGADATLAVVQPPVRSLEHAVRELRVAMDALPERAGRASASAVLTAPLLQVGAALAELATHLDGVAEVGPELARCRDRSTDLATRLIAWLGRRSNPASPGQGRDVAAIGAECESGPARVGGLDDDPFALPPLHQDRDWPQDSHDDADSWPDDAPTRRSADEVFWYEHGNRGFVFHRTPLDVSGPLREFRERSGGAWLFVSATLAVAGRFDHFINRLGLDAPKQLLQPSPFDWPRQALCYLPPNLPEPGTGHYTRALVAAIRPVLSASGGRAFLLFTSHRALREAADALADDQWPLFVQGRMPRQALLDGFRLSGNGVLLGAASFWEGVDVVGDALSVVVIDRLPFAAPDDPVLEARLDAIERSGGNPFRDEQLPTAALALKQGVGRLIRSDRDRGVLVLCDPRLLTRPYGRVFLNSLPPMPRTRDREQVTAFFVDRNES
ncbi:MAG TPA: helicase [Xanthomonadales bacterium]|nr:helicase [Xanthomonadales bacterium]